MLRLSREHCGKSFTTKDVPVPGRVYRLKCRACGNVMQVVGSAPSSTPAPAPDLAGAKPAETPSPTSDKAQRPPLAPSYLDIFGDEDFA
jgi:hypothetical protein